MKKSTATAVATTCLGLAAAGTAYMLSGNNKEMRRKTKTFRRNTEKALRQVGSFLENASDMMR